jgi:multiple sugar transport system permease protein
LKSTRVRGSQLHGTLMFLPYLILMFAWAIYPLIIAVTTSFQSSRAVPGGGIGNYIFVLSDFRFVPALMNVSIFLAIYLPAMLILVAGMSLLLDTIKTKHTVPLRLMYLVPATITGSVAVLVWYFMLEPTYSPIAGLLAEVGWTQGTDVFNKGNLPWIFALIAFSTGAGNWIVIQYGSLQSIPDDILEAARIDGASSFQTAFRIKLPLIKKYLVYMLILAFAAAIQIFVEPYLMSSVPSAIGVANDWSLNQLAYNLAFRGSNLGAATALSFMLLILCTILALWVIYRTDFFDEAEIKTRKKEVKS